MQVPALLRRDALSEHAYARVGSVLRLLVDSSPGLMPLMLAELDEGVAAVAESATASLSEAAVRGVDADGALAAAVASRGGVVLRLLHALQSFHKDLEQQQALAQQRQERQQEREQQQRQVAELQRLRQEQQQQEQQQRQQQQEAGAADAMATDAPAEAAPATAADAAAPAATAAAAPAAGTAAAGAAAPTADPSPPAAGGAAAAGAAGPSTSTAPAAIPSVAEGLSLRSGLTAAARHADSKVEAAEKSLRALGDVVAHVTARTEPLWGALSACIGHIESNLKAGGQRPLGAPLDASAAARMLPPGG